MRHVLALLLALATLPALAAQPVRSVPELDISRYAGQWHEIGHLPVFFQRKCVGDITASYTLRDDGMIGVLNACRTGDGSQEASAGIARSVEGHPGRLQVRFAPDWLSWVPMVWADYWVIDLDPGYQWAVVASPNRKYLWVLSRTPSMERGLFERIKARAEAMGFDLEPLVIAAPLT
ncbi:apolipoprotein D and lipocalin family protein [Luteimonas cucumeris]|uniref:Outer membrane lipoprotein Blc n=1 Tax=Luteimonas cucumeris TaxID=985012 RepID=A0A562LBM8_9GAMM|nr:lipocalin family protein [Luteimonas cucumeris]TWI05030.1 apolipoprotein D and lipocalin family protein [Luteimonas cucumeris]